MGKHHIIEDTIQILESIVERASIIQQDSDRELCLDIDLMLEDLRLLYRNYEALKKHCEAGHVPEKNKREVPGHSDSKKPSDTIHPKQSVDKSEDTLPEEGQPIPSFFTEEELEKEEKVVADSHSTALSEDPDTAPQKPIQADPSPSVQPEPEPKRTEQHQPAESSKNQPAVSPDEPAAAYGQTESKRPGDGSGSNGKTIIDLFSQHQTRSIGDQFGHDDNSLHQRISSQKEDKSIGSRLQQHPINNIKDAIGLNEKFLFINELFEGDIQAYNEAIAKLNNMGTIKEAFNYMNELTTIHHWDAKRSAETIEKLAGFVQRRYL